MVISGSVAADPPVFTIQMDAAGTPQDVELGATTLIEITLKNSTVKY